MKIRWTNKYSGECGYVKRLNRKEGYFVNTFDADEAKQFSEKSLSRILKLLQLYCNDNTYHAIDV